MMTLRVILDEILTPLPGIDPRYAEELARALIAAAPRGTDVEGVVSASTEAEYEEIAARLPGLGGLYKSALARRELVLAWHRGFTRLPGGGMIHSPSLLAPLARHDRLNNTGDQIVVTIHGTAAWTDPDRVPGRAASWIQGMGKRARRYADAIVVPTHAVAAQVAEVLDVGDRVRVIEAAPSSTLTLPVDAEAHRSRLGLRGRFLVAPTLGAGASATLKALALLDDDVLLAVLDGDSARVVTEVAAERVVILPALTAADRAAVLDGAAALLHVEGEVGFGLPLLDAFALGTPVVHADDAEALEIAADAALAIEPGDDASRGERIADAVRRVLDDRELADRLAVFGQDRARVFSWRSTAEKTWQLHADL
jgi:glycosyltransferase involved in cell wall biosynthesis